ncbi:hypothetical protein I4F81_002130 [Pyropia yezoensis]|uniref:Uncharacterized protein n=1 Tax=Pyropia yezoensis TaxID=2788 RepID=A0ACC3BP74_PYRYE|nr:hypothetical protein I4F81_002130 [Neopyropia yezoensis]
MLLLSAGERIALLARRGVDASHRHVRVRAHSAGAFSVVLPPVEAVALQRQPPRDIGQPD